MKTRPWANVGDLKVPHDPNAENAVLAASSILFSLSGQKYGGIFRATEQYACETSGAPTGCVWDAGANAYWNPALGAYAFIQGMPRRSRLLPGSAIRLRNQPVRSIVEITVHGAVVNPNEYRLYNNAIVRLASGVSWGLCSAPLIKYDYGTNPPILGQMAATVLANELVAAMRGDECRLPSSVTSVSRQGISFEVYDPQDFIDKGRVGLYEVDIFLSSINPGGAKKRPRVFSPDTPRAYGR